MDEKQMLQDADLSKLLLELESSKNWEEPVPRSTGALKSYIIISFATIVFLGVKLWFAADAYDNLLDQWVDIELENRVLKAAINKIYNGAVPLPEVNQSPFDKPEEFEL